MDRRELLKGIGALSSGVLSCRSALSQASSSAGPESIQLATGIRALVRRNGRLMQPVRISPRPGTTGEVRVSIDGVEVDRRALTGVGSPFDVYLEPSPQTRTLHISVEADKSSDTATIDLKPARQVLIYVLPHSHHDLGYTDLQAAVEEKQMQNITLAMDLAEKTSKYPDGARFVWNLEVLWGCDFFMQRRSAAEKQRLIEAIRNGQISPQGSYANELTGLCRPEELLRLFKYGTHLGKQCGVNVDSAMMSDVPGYSWGTVAAMSQAGIRYFSGAPNFFDRIGSFMETWQDRPFWWISPSGREKVLMWVPWTGYALSHITKKLDEAWVGKYEDRLDEVLFPYDVSYIRWSGHGDNATPDPEISDFVRDWNSRYEWPRFAIASTSTAFSAFEKKFGHQLPSYRGDLTPYWEDGAGSSALETAMSRNAADRITQAATLSSMLAPEKYVESAYATAWRDVLMYSEHTWGAWCSVSDSENPFTKKQWEYKRDFAVKAESRSEALLAASLPAPTGTDSLDVHNTASWRRTAIVMAPAELSAGGDCVETSDGKLVPSQRLKSGELAMMASDIPPLASARLKLSSKPAHAPTRAVTVKESTLTNEFLKARVDPESGDIVGLFRKDNPENLVNREQGALNQYLFLSGVDFAHIGRSGKPIITVEEAGPLVACLRIESSAPGCKQLVRRVRLCAGSDFLEIVNTVDKERAPLNPHPGKGDQGDDFAQHGSKESVQFAFPLAVPGGKMLLDIPLGAMQPEIDQLPGSCKNWLPVGRWIDVSNEASGVTWATLDAPLVEIGGITATMLGSQKIPAIWRKHIEPTQTFFSWVMNNHWGTNYLAYQSGPVTFRYALRPHGHEDIAEASRFATGLSQPLLVARAGAREDAMTSLLTVEPASVLLQELKPSDDGKAWIVRLFAASDEAVSARLLWPPNRIGQIFLSNLSEEALHPVEGDISIAGWDLVTLRLERT